MFQTIADLAQAPVKAPVVVGQDMLAEAKPHEHFEEHRREYHEEMDYLEHGGDDRAGNAAWRSAMHSLGRR